MSKKIFVANWKMNPQTIEEAKELCNLYIQETSKYPNITVVICPPILYVEELSGLLAASNVANLFLGIQDFFWEESGAFTGEISLNMLKKFNIQYALVGHSERRYIKGETDEMVNKKLLAAMWSNITPILLIGEKEKDDFKEDIFIDQLARGLKGVEGNEADRLVIAYEPVWAISSKSSGQSDNPDNTVEAIKTIRNILRKMYDKNFIDLPMLYGGSVNSGNIENFLSRPEIFGAAVGSASIKKEEIPFLLEVVSKQSH